MIHKTRPAVVALLIAIVGVILACVGPAGASPTPPQTATDTEARAALVQLDDLARDQWERTLLRSMAGRPALIDKRIAVVGDSMSVGYGSVDMQGYRPYLADLMDRRGYHVIFAPCLCNGGWSVNDLNARLPAYVQANPTIDLALLAIGTNDVSWGMDLTGWGPKYDQAVRSLLSANAGTKVVGTKIPLSATQNPTGRTDLAIYENAINGWIQTSLDSFNQSNPGRVTSADPKIPSSWLLDQGWHPGDAGYRLWAQAVFNAMVAAGWLPNNA